MKQLFKNQQGQMTVGFYIALMALLLFLIVGYKGYQQLRLESAKNKYKSLALDVARSGFSDTQAFFLRQSTAVGYTLPISGTTGASGNYPNGITPAASLWPDDAFQPGLNDTDYYTLVSFTSAAGNPTVKGIVRNFPMTITFTGGTELTTPRVWGRYVVRRQNYRNWWPMGVNNATAADFYGVMHPVSSDPDAAHDLSGLRAGSGDGNGNAGGGNTWGISARGYVYAGPSDLSDTTRFENGDLLGKPLAKYPATYSVVALRNTTLLLASAKIYGEIAQINMQCNTNYPVEVYKGNNVNLNNASISGAGSLPGIVRTDSTLYGGGGTLNPSNQYAQWAATVNPNNPAANPSLSFVFPGSSLNDLANLADYVGDVSIFPDPNFTSGCGCAAETTYSQRTSTDTFYFIQGNAIFDTANTRRMSGIGLVLVNGNLTIQDGNKSDWAGIVYVNGNVTMNSGSISGTLIATGTVNLTGGTLLATYVNANPNVALEVANHLKAYRVKKSTVQSY